jgi:ubiquinone/menaquinone biosynthesis C-methylase UbiE
MTQRRYLPAAGWDFFLPLYDPIVRLFGFRKALDPLIEQAQLEPGHMLLDVGCGTGTLAVDVKRRYPAAHIAGVDPDPKALAIARRKAARAGVSVQFDQAFGDALPYQAGRFDRVFSSLMFHHLAADERQKVLVEILRVVKPGGRLEFLDFAAGTHSFLAQVTHGRHPLSPEAEDRFLCRLYEAGFSTARRIADRHTLFGGIAFYQAVK